ncbi:MAG: ribosome biogenesis GTP-binding protein YihA/YsxC [Chitinophagales bacterium]|nr:ribosome biogenesis GTP-binding protein YihA/YsxC [Chitinophagales bacterium]
MFIKTANFIGSYPSISKCPPPQLPEYAFIGRSNVGKSSLVNLITGNKGLAKVSQTPGKTQTINFFLVNDAWWLVDLPGYGYAKTSQKNRGQWSKMTADYLEKRESLQCVFLLIDSRLPPQTVDITFANWLGASGIPFVIVFTKADKNSKNELASNVAAFKKEFLKHWETMPQYFITSAEKREGQEDLLSLIDSINGEIA